MSQYARVDGGVVRELFTVPDGHDLADCFVPDIAGQFVAIPDSVSPADGWTFDGTTFALPVFAVPPPVVPGSVSAAQARIALSRAGKLDAVTSAVSSAGGEILIWFDYATAWERQNAHVLALGSQVGLSTSDIDNLFIAAGQIAA